MVDRINRRLRLPMSIEPIGPLKGDAVNVLIDLRGDAR
jgi:hypothetical protein